MSRSPCPRGLEAKLNREVHFFCPLCGNLPLVRAHTTKTYGEVGWNYDYLLSICVECEKKVEAGKIPRTILHEIKQQLRLSFETSNRVRPHQISLPDNNSVFIGNNRIASTDIIFKFEEFPIIWFELVNGTRVLSARFYDANGTVTTAIDKNQWTADRSKFYDIESVTNEGNLKLGISSRRDDTKIELLLTEKGLTVGPSVFYIPGNKIQILSNGDLMIGTNRFSNCGIFNCGAAFAFS